MMPERSRTQRLYKEKMAALEKEIEQISDGAPAQQRIGPDVVPRAN